MFVVPAAIVPSSNRRRAFVHPVAHRALTLIEVLVALAAAMLILAAVVNVLGLVTKGIADSRSIVESTSRLRSAQHLLRTDLAGATCPGIVWQRGEMGNGYFEVIEGLQYDAQNQVPGTTAQSLGGDPDDVLIFTARSLGQPFVGKVNGNTITSDKAEIVWFMTQDRTYPNGPQVYSLRRRIFLIVNDTAGVTPTQTNTNPSENYDISFRANPAGGGNIPNTLGTLGNRRNRIFHNTSIATCFATPTAFNTPANMAFPASGAREGEDIVLSNVLSFDVKVFDTTATVYQQSSVPGMGLIPDDVGYSKGTSTGALGAFVDLGRSIGSTTTFTTSMGAGKPSNAITVTGLPTYDTWTFDYENDGVAQGGGGVDPAVNGQDDDGANGVDDANERETFPPYPYALRGIQVKIRVYDPVSKSVREVTVEETFVN